ncbi:hypothetical protein D3C76_1350720 [compost metagenome]
MFGKDILASSLHKYIAICLGNATLLDLLSLTISVTFILKNLHTTCIISLLVNILVFFTNIDSIVLSTTASVRSLLVNDVYATNLLNTPSNSLIFDFTFVAILMSISSFII